MISQGETPQRAIWLPFLEALAAQIEGCSLQALVADATRWANALPRIAKLVDAKAIAVGFLDEHCLEAFIAMPEEPWRHDSALALLECVGRLVETVRPERELVVALPGPARICRSLGLSLDRAALERIKPGLVKLLELLGERRPELIVLDETSDDEWPLTTADYRRVCNTLKNVTEYFGIPLGLRVSGYADGAATIEALRPLRLGHLLLGRPRAGALSTAATLAAAEAQGWHSLGLPLESDDRAADLPQRNTACYWCSPVQESDLELARKRGQAAEG